ncbi:MAG: hypothetical protein JNM24_01800 [Bdellovibrionaceae bacterium]|nr:hypothetical protein [Pseudobdellovibrionaceae bacterium]
MIFFLVRISLFVVSTLVLSCDGPNADGVGSESSDRGVHNADGFQVILKVNNGASITPDLAVALQLSAVGADEMYITQESACNIGGTWESFRSFKQWTLQKSNEMNFFYVKFRNSQRESDCAFTSIEHDSMAPTLILNSPVDGSVLVDSAELPLAGTCTEEATVNIKLNSAMSFLAQCKDGVWAKTLDVSAVPSGNISIELKVIDQVMNSSGVQNFTFIK